MNFYVLTADIGQHGVITMSLSLKDQSSFATLPTCAVQTSAQVNAKLQGHIETRQPLGMHLDTRKIMDAPIAFSDHRRDLSYADISAIRGVESATWIITGQNDREDNRAKNGLVAVKWTIDEDRLGGWKVKLAPPGQPAARSWPVMPRVSP